MIPGEILAPDIEFYITRRRENFSRNHGGCSFLAVVQVMG